DTEDLAGHDVLECGLRHRALGFVLRHLFLAPKMAVPMRTRVEPSAIASSRSSDMPAEIVSSASPARRASSCSERNRAYGARPAPGSGMAITPRSLRCGSTATA